MSNDDLISSAKPADEIEWNNTGIALYQAGRSDEARQAFESAIDHNPAYTTAWYNLGDLIPLEQIDHWLAKAADHIPQAASRAPWYFFLAQLYDRKAEYKTAAEYYLKGNQYAEADIPTPWQQSAATELYSRISQFNYAISSQDTRDEAEDCQQTLVFIVGMPRSGSTLASRVVAGLEDSLDLGEARHLVNTINEYCGKSDGRFPDALANASEEDYTELRESYLAKAANPGNRYIIDKYLENYLFAGIIPRIFPQAKIIWCKRQPEDIFISCFKHYFGSNVKWSNNTTTIVQYHALLDRYMSHWQNCMPANQLFQLDYEKLVHQPDATLAKLAAFLEVGSKQLSLTPTNTSARIKTASAMQVRKPLYQHAVGSYAHYKPYIVFPKACDTAPEIKADVIDKVKIFGERHTATNAVARLIQSNFEAQCQYFDFLGWKHRRAPLKKEWQKADADHTLFIFTVRNPYTWLKAMHREPYYNHQPDINDRLFRDFIRYPLEDYENCMAMWNEKNREFIRMAEEVPHGLIIRLEDFSLNQQASFAAMCNFMTPNGAYQAYTKYYSGDGEKERPGEMSKQLSLPPVPDATYQIINEWLDPELMQYFGYEFVNSSEAQQTS
ncbi:MAG: sulfotransferase [Pseudomonadales bacterium]